MKAILIAVAMSAIFMACKKETKSRDYSAIASQVQASTELQSFIHYTTEIYKATVGQDTNVNAYIQGQAKAVWAIQIRFSLTHDEMLKVFDYIQMLPEQPGITTNGVTGVTVADPCTRNAWLAFAKGSLVCIATAAVPVMGEVLAPLCTQSIIADLALALHDCAAAK